MTTRGTQRDVNPSPSACVDLYTTVIGPLRNIPLDEHEPTHLTIYYIPTRTASGGDQCLLSGVFIEVKVR